MAFLIIFSWLASSISVLVLSSLRSSVCFNISISFMNNLAGLVCFHFWKQNKLFHLKEIVLTNFRTVFHIHLFSLNNPCCLYFSRFSISHRCNKEICCNLNRYNNNNNNFNFLLILTVIWTSRSGFGFSIAMTTWPLSLASGEASTSIIQ